MLNRLRFLKFTISLIFFALFLQLFSITQNPAYLTLSENQITKTTTLYDTRGVIYDRNFQPLSLKYSLQTVTLADKTTNYLMPQQDFSIAPHIIGYLSDGSGVCGIEAAYEELLSKNSQTAMASIPQIGNGSVSKSAEISLHQPPVPENGVILTLDHTLQSIAMSQESYLKKGAIVCMDAETGEILSLCSFPNFHSPAQALKDPDLPLFNRTLAAYPVGSVMKPFIAAAALESGISPELTFDCTGNITIQGLTFGCHDKKGHGVLNLSEAIIYSCNPYFVNLTRDINENSLLSIAQDFGFGQSIYLCDGLMSDSGTLPQTLSIGEKANFSFGQGKLTATPLQICSAYAALANGGTYHTPTLIKGTTEDRKTLQAVPPPIPHNTIRPNTNRILTTALLRTVKENEDSLAKSDQISIYGKTGTAQTGQYQNGQELLIGWFAGWFQAKGRTIAITAMAEQAESGNKNAAPIVRQIAEHYNNTKTPDP